MKAILETETETEMAGAGLEAIPIRRSATDLRLLLRSTVEVMNRQATAMDVTLTLVTDDGLPAVVRLDRDKIAWTIATVIGNAFRHVRRGTRLHPGGTVTVRASVDAARTPEVTIEVQDDGYGIPADKLPFLLEGDEQHPPSGLSLLLIRDVIAAHGGRIDVHSSTSAHDRGTRVRLILPVISESRAT